MKRLLLTLIIATHAQASIEVWAPGSVVSNPRFQSPNGRYTVVFRRFPAVPDFGSMPVEAAMAAEERPGNVVPELVTKFAFYEGRRLRGVAESGEWPRDVLVPDSGRTFVVVGMHQAFAPDSTLFTIFGRDGAFIHAARAGDLFSDDDLGAMRMGNRPSVALAGDQLHLVLNVGHDRHETIRIDALTGRNLDPEKRDLLPVWRVWNVAAAVFPEDRRQKVPMQCASGIDPASAVRIAPRQLHARAVTRPLPDYPSVAKKVRIAGTVWVEVVVSESGSVVCTRTSGPPFGIDQAARQVVQQWRFEPYLVDGRPVAFTSDIELGFGQVTRQELATIDEAP
ncbi:MAG TPA: TonB family protein [Thermoanaerobaculia bacterium]|jgi:TonB family protein